jgi:hypothetical protein
MKNAWREESLMKSVLLFFAMTMMTIAGSVVAQAQTATADAQTPFQFELAQADGPRGLGVEGYVHTFDPSPSSGRRTLLARPPRILREAGSR